MYLLITTQEWIWFACVLTSLCTASFCLGGGLCYLQGLSHGQKDKAINYPELPVDKMFIDINFEIKKAKNDSDLYAAYNNILIFESEHGKMSAGLVSTLYERYAQKEWELSEMTIV